MLKPQLGLYQHSPTLTSRQLTEFLLVLILPFLFGPVRTGNLKLLHLFTFVKPLGPVSHM